MRAEVVGAAAQRGLEAVPGDVRAEGGAAGADLQEVPGREPGGLALCDGVQQLLGLLQPLPEQLPLLAADVLGAGCRPCLPRPGDLAGTGEQQRQGRVRLGGDRLGQPALAAGGLGELGDQPRQVRLVRDGAEAARTACQSPAAARARRPRSSSSP
ncbi:hypothetical protein ACFQ1I_05665 [Kitasatospora arboriphila]